MNKQNVKGNAQVVVVSLTKQGPVAKGAFKPFADPRDRNQATQKIASLSPGDLALIGKRQSLKIGNQNSVEAVLDALTIDSGMKEFTADEIKAATKVAKLNPNDAKRRDLTNLPTFTIDGDYSRDFDDAISARREGDKIRVWVHVADVSAYVKPDTILDRAARSRATSFYLPTKVMPMLPEELSNNVCSLVPNKTRRAVTCELLMEHGHVISFDFYRSMIKSDARLTYDRVNQIFFGLIEPGPTYAAALDAAREASEADSFVEQYSHEASFSLNGGQVTSINYKARGKSEYLIERLMILANQAAAQFIDDKGLMDQKLYRVHDGTSDFKAQTSLAKLQSLGVKAQNLAIAKSSIDEMYENKEIDTDKYQVLSNLISHINIAAEYTNELRPHSGLAIAAYTHFTSPIRRYADILVHRMILNAIDDEDFTIDPVALTEVIDHINEQTFLSRKIERKSSDICRASYLNSKKITTPQNGVVTGMIQGGLFVKIMEAEGFVQSRELTGSMDENGAIWNMDKGPIELGDSLMVCVQSIDLVQGRVRLKISPKTSG